MLCGFWHHPDPEPTLECLGLRMEVEDEDEMRPGWNRAAQPKDISLSGYGQGKNRSEGEMERHMHGQWNDSCFHTEVQNIVELLIYSAVILLG
jgi:hypothetical protein